MFATQDLGRFVADFPAGALPEPTRAMASLLLLDLLAATGAGLQAPLAVAARRAAADLGAPGPATVWMTGLKLDIASAAMANAAAASALDIDDGHRGAAGHPGAGVIPAALAVGEANGNSDEEILEAIVLGYDVALRVATARPVETITTYASGLWVGFGVAAAAGRLLKLDGTTIAHALGIVGAEGPIALANGTTKFQGSTVKEMIPAAVTAGLVAAYRARHGATGPLDLLDREALYRRDILLGDLGGHWWIEGCYLKPYAACRYMHAAIDALLVLRKPERPVTSLRIETFARGLRLSNSRHPASLEAGQYSYPFSCALAALRGEAALQPVDPASLSDPEVLKLAARIELVAHDDFTPLFPAGTPCRVILDQGDGPEVMTVLSPRGDVANPMRRDEVITKFRRITRATLCEAAQDRILVALDGLLEQGFAPVLRALALADPETLTAPEALAAPEQVSET